MDTPCLYRILQLGAAHSTMFFPLYRLLSDVPASYFQYGGFVSKENKIVDRVSRVTTSFALLLQLRFDLT